MDKLDTKPYMGPDLKPNIANKTLFLGEVVDAYADEAYTSERNFPDHVYGLRFKKKNGNLHKRWGQNLGEVMVELSDERLTNL